MREVPEKIGRYTILCELGLGGMATVYLGRSRGLGDFERLFAIKMIHENLCESPEFVALFLNEARIAARIHHPHVVQVYDIDIEDGRYYLSMDYVSGETLNLALQETWNKDVPFPIDVASHVVACACEGLHAAHDLTDDDGDPLGVVHRDVAPQNILLGYDGIVRVMDFGIAKALDQVSLTQPGTLRGSVPYMSPEQVQKTGAIDRRTDVFALGVVLWETTIGKRLFQHHTVIGTIARIIGMEIPRPSTLRSDYPQRLEEIVMKALERDPERRFQTAEEMGEELRRFLVASGICTTASTIRSFVEQSFGERHTQRRTMERTASRIHAPDRVESLPALPKPKQVLTPVVTRVEPIDDPQMARRIIEIVRPAGASVAEDFDAQPPTEVTELPKVKPRPRTSAVRRAPPKKPVLPVLSALVSCVLLVVLGAAIWPESAESVDERQEDELVELIEEPDDPLMTGSVSITDMAGDGGKKGTVVFYFRVIPPGAKIHVNGEPKESDLVVPQSRARYTIRFSSKGHRPLVVTVTGEASRLIEANLEPLPKVKTKRRRRRR